MSASIRLACVPTRTSDPGSRRPTVSGRRGYRDRRADHRQQRHGDDPPGRGDGHQRDSVQHRLPSPRSGRSDLAYALTAITYPVRCRPARICLVRLAVVQRSSPRSTSVPGPELPSRRPARAVAQPGRPRSGQRGHVASVTPSIVAIAAAAATWAVLSWTNAVRSRLNQVSGAFGSGSGPPATGRYTALTSGRAAAGTM